MTLAGFHHIAAYTALTQERLIPQPSQVRYTQDRSPTLNRKLLSAIGKEEAKRSTVDSLNPTNLSEETMSVIASISEHSSYVKQLELYSSENTIDTPPLETDKRSISLYI